jgi:hypothetical protein
MKAGEEIDLERVRGVFKTWLRALAADPDAAVAAALVYEDLSPDARAAWLDAIAEDARGLDVPAVALYAPLLAVEHDEARRLRMMEAIRAGGIMTPSPAAVRAWHGSKDGERAALLVAPVYLAFVEVVGARYREDEGFRDFIYVPLAHALDPLPDIGMAVEPAMADDVIEELALAVLAHERTGQPRPAAAQALVRYLSPVIGPAA